MKYVYFICIGKRRSKNGHFASYFAYANKEDALSRVATIAQKKGGWTFEPDRKESRPKHAVAAWSNKKTTIWLERLKLEE